MVQMLIRKAGYKSVIVVGLLLLAQTSLALAGDEILGDWEITIDFGGRKSYAALSITKNEDGTLKGKWGSSDRLFDVKYEDGKVTFTRTIGPPDREFTSDYEGTLKDGKLMLTITNDFGDMSAVGERPKPMCPALGQWNINFKVEGFDMDIEAKLTISKTADGKFEGKWIENVGEHSVSDIKFENGKLSLKRHSNVEGMEFDSTYAGTIKGNELIGTLTSEMGDIPANGKRHGAELVGEWELTTVSDFGERTSMMRIFGDLTGRYEFFDSEIPMKDIKIEGNQVTFVIEMGFGDRTFQMDFKGELDDKNLKGQMESDRGTSDVTGKKMEKKTKEKKSEPATK
jgi:hypothetical protein